MTGIFVYEHLTASNSNAEPADSLAREGRAMRDAIVTDFATIPDVTVVPFPAGGDTDKFDSLVQTCDAALVIAPEFDGILESLVRRVEDAGVLLLGPSAKAVRLTADKLATAQCWTSAGVPTPRTSLAVDWPAERVPCVLKPRDGAGSVRTYYCTDADSFHRYGAASHSAGEMIACEYVLGTAVSVSFLIGPAGVITLPPAYQFVTPATHFSYAGGEVPIPSPLAERAGRLGRRAVECVPGLTGYVGVDLVLGRESDGSSDFAIEINPRLTTSYVGLRAQSVNNLAGCLLSVCTGNRPETLRWKPGRTRFFPDGTVETTPE